MEVDGKWYDRFRPAIVLSTVPITFLAVLFVWGYCQSWANHAAVSAFLDNHREIIARESNDSRVHRFAISHDPEYSGRLLIEIDVDDKETYFKLENALHNHDELNEYPRFVTRVRSGEDLGMDLGAAAAGVGIAVSGFADALFRLCVAGVLSAVVFIITLFVSRRTAPLSE